MATLYRGECSACGHKTPTMPAGYGAVLVDQPVERKQHQVVGAVMSDGSGVDFAMGSDPYLVILSHPAETSILQTTGFTWDDLRREGRYVACTNVVCDECGRLYTLKRVAVPEAGCTGCLVPLVTGVCCGLTVGIWSGNVLFGWFVTCGVGYLATLALDWKARHALKSYFPERAAQLKEDSVCPKCEGEQSTPVASRSPVRCQKCQMTSMLFRIAGRS